MEKKASDYYADLEKESVKHSLGPRPNFNSVRKPPPFPWTKTVFIVACLVFIADKMKWLDRPIEFVNAFYRSKIHSLVPGQNRKPASATRQEAEVATKPTQALESPYAQLATQKDVDQGDFVQIQGKYYKYRKDNVYIINGKRVYFYDDRRRAAAAKQGSDKSAPAAPTTGQTGLQPTDMQKAFGVVPRHPADQVDKQ